MKIQISGLFLLLIFLLTPYCIAANSPDMQVYCTGKSPKISFPLPGQPESANVSGYEEAYAFKDTTNVNSYQFLYKKIDKTLNLKTYLEGVIVGRIRSLNATLLTKKISTSGGKVIAKYSYYYYVSGVRKLSHVKALALNGIYCSWAVQSYEGVSIFEAESIFENYSKYLDADGSYCK